MIGTTSSVGGLELVPVGRAVAVQDGHGRSVT